MTIAVDWDIKSQTKKNSLKHCTVPNYGTARMKRELTAYERNFVNWKCLNRYFGKQRRTRCNAKECGFYSGSSLFAKIKQSSGIEVHLNLELLTCNLLICTMKHRRFIVLKRKE